MPETWDFTIRYLTLLNLPHEQNYSVRNWRIVSHDLEKRLGVPG